MEKTERFIELDSTYTESCAKLFQKAFAGEPWNDDWSDEHQLLEYIREVSGGYHAMNFGLLIDGKLVAISMGAIHHWWEGANYNIEELCVDPDYQGQGIGTKFVSLIEEETKKRGLAGIFLQTDADKPSFKFYEKLGFQNLTLHVSMYRSNLS